MFDYSKQVEAFRSARVRLPSTFRDKLLFHRQANRDRLISRLPSFIKQVRIGNGNFKPQGSVAVGTIIQTRFTDEEYDIDDGLVIPRSQLKNDDGEEMTSAEVREAVRKSLMDRRFNRQPKLFPNCVRVFYADEDEEKHHVDFPVYRKWSDDEGTTIRELASEEDWVLSNPTQVNKWFDDLVKDRNSETQEQGTQLRRLVQLLKRYCRSRKTWLKSLPNGMKLMMLVAECQPPYNPRIDKAFRELLEKLKTRLERSKVIRNMAHPSQPMITRTEKDANVEALLERVREALERIETLDKPENDTEAAARGVWDWVFQSDGFFEEYDEEAQAAKRSSLGTGTTRFDVPWRQAPLWRIDLRYSASITGKWSRSNHGIDWRVFSNDGPALDRHLHLRFFGSTDVPTPYQVFWQVVNTGSAAHAAGGLRGEIIASKTVGVGGLHSSTAPGVERAERTLYPGMHWVECFIVKDGVCVARSGPFVVNIR